MAKNKYYAVKKGYTPGVYDTWDTCKAEVEGFSGAEYKGFPTESAAQAWLDGISISTNKQISDDVNSIKEYAGKHVDIFVDGSYNSETGEYGCGIFVDDPVRPKILTAKGNCEAGGRNVEGEIQAATIALKYAINSGKYDSVTIHHDLEHIGTIADKKYKAGTIYTQRYSKFVDSVRSSGLAVDFHHVKGHTGVEGNEIVDKLAKIACGVPLTNTETAYINQWSHVDGFPKQLINNNDVEVAYESQNDFSLG